MHLLDAQVYWSGKKITSARRPIPWLPGGPFVFRNTGPGQNALISIWRACLRESPTALSQAPYQGSASINCSSIKLYGEQSELIVGRDRTCSAGLYGTSPLAVCLRNPQPRQWVGFSPNHYEAIRGWRQGSLPFLAGSERDRCISTIDWLSPLTALHLFRLCPP